MNPETFKEKPRPQANKTPFPISTGEGIRGRITEKSGRRIEYGEGKAIVEEKRDYLDLRREFTESEGVIYVEDLVWNPGHEDWVTTGKRVYDKDVDEIVTTATSIRDLRLRPTEEELDKMPIELANIYRLQIRNDEHESLTDDVTSYSKEISVRLGGKNENEILKEFFGIENSIYELRTKEETIKEEIRDALKIYNSSSSKETREKAKETIAILRKKHGKIEQQIRISEERNNELEQKVNQIERRLNDSDEFQLNIDGTNDEQTSLIQMYLQRLTRERASKSLSKDDYEIIESVLLRSNPSLTKDTVETIIKDLVLRRTGRILKQNLDAASKIDKNNDLLKTVLQNPNNPTFLKNLSEEKAKEYILILESILENSKLCDILGGIEEIIRVQKEIRNESGVK